MMEGSNGKMQQMCSAIRRLANSRSYSRGMVSLKMNNCSQTIGQVQLMSSFRRGLDGSNI